jgi:hypothetical protein
MHGKLILTNISPLHRVGKNYTTEIAAKVFSMARYGKMRIRERSNGGYVHRPKQRSFNAIQKYIIVYKTVPDMQGIA